jgi:multiple sugar transport system substrate-binding protein
MKKKRIIVPLVLVCVLIGAFFLGGCSKSGDTLLDPKNPVTVTLWHYYVGENQQALEEAVADFNQTEGIEKGVFVEPVAMGSIAELEEAVTNSAKGVINSSEMPDIFSSYPDKALEIDNLGMLTDLNEYFTDEEKQLYVQDFLEEGLFDEGRLLVVPVVKSTELLYVNDTDWNAFAQDAGRANEQLATWESIYDVAKQYYDWVDEKTPEQWDGKGLIGIDSVANYVIIGNKQLGTAVISAEKDGVVINEDAMRSCSTII